MNKVYLITITQGMWDDFHWWIDSIYDSPEKAEKRKREIEVSIDFAKMEYLNKYGVDFEDSMHSLIDGDDFDEKEYYEVTRRNYTYRHENPQLEYNKITIEEKEVL